MKYGLDVSIDRQYADPRLLADLAAEAERAGWDGFFLQDFLIAEQPAVDPWIALAVIAVQTERVRIGAFMTALPRRRPWKVARETATLDRLSQGRLIFGVGLGTEADFSSFGEEASLPVRGEKLDEGLAVLSELWTGNVVSYHGRHYHIAAQAFLPRPVQLPRIPIWVAGSWPNLRPFRRAARWDGVYVMTKRADGERVTPADIRQIVAYVTSQREANAPFDIAFADETPAVPEESLKIIQPYAEAGVTWWLEGIWGPLDAARERIRAGPPEIGSAS